MQSNSPRRDEKQRGGGTGISGPPALKKLVEAVQSRDKEAVQALLGDNKVTEEELNGLFRAQNEPFERSVLHVACTEKSWDLAELLIQAKAKVNLQDGEGSTAFLCAVKAGAPLTTVQTMVEAGADITISNIMCQTAIFHATDPKVIAYLLQRLNGNYALFSPQLATSLSGSDKTLLMNAVSTFYSVSLSDKRKVVDLPASLWSRIIHLLRVDPTNVVSVQPITVLNPLLAAIHNFAIESRYSEIIGSQPGSFAFLFGLSCKHPSEKVQHASLNALFVLSRLEKNKEILASKWFLVLVKLFCSPNQQIQAKAAHIMAEVSIGNDEAKAKVTKEIGVAKLVSLLQTPDPELRYDTCRLLTNITNKQIVTQKSVLAEGGLAALLKIVANNNEPQETCVCAMTAIANLAQLLLDKGFDAETFKKVKFTAAVLESTKGDNEEMKEQTARALAQSTKHKLMANDFLDQDGISAILPLISSTNDLIKQNSIAILCNIVKRFKRKLSGREDLVTSLKSVTLQESSVDTQKLIKKALSRLQPPPTKSS